MGEAAAEVSLLDVARAERSAAEQAQHERRAKILSDTAAKLLARKDPNRIVMPALYRALKEELIIDATLGFIVVSMDAPMRLGFMQGFDREMMERCVTLDFGQAICGTVAMTRQPMHVTDIQHSLDPIADLVRSAGINAYACEPLLFAGRLLGTISFASRSRRSFEIEDLLLFRAIAQQVASARARVARRPN